MITKDATRKLRNSNAWGPRARIGGFEFPLQHEEEIEHLELVVRTDHRIRAEFIYFLRNKKSPKMDVVDCFSLFFSDHSMVNFSWNGVSNQRFPKRAMKSYDIFTTCMLEAWFDQGISSEIITSRLKRTIEKINNRRNVQRSKRRRKEKLLAIAEPNSDKTEQMIPKVKIRQDLLQHSVRCKEQVGCFEIGEKTDYHLAPLRPLRLSEDDGDRTIRTNYTFPITDPDTLEDLEHAVRNDFKTRQRYIDFLKRIKTRDEELSSAEVFRRICSDSAIFTHFSFTTATLCVDGRKREALRDFIIFGVCMFDAWSDHNDIAVKSLTLTMKRLIKRINVRNYARLEHQKCSNL
ncbi:uncharacterized protein LOC129762928 isoform X2 [Toxorhynchites rutilus septentrionalis]|uniref:uncharacterized protein LOC129762928 isoform X2 n=1 Tax=Toxorhynchites rutilus septentrionalis TaxID=329112 RepID=UPI00247A7710|nr:uncharacterized protein LOC129762928 isoform X2 [Toxorhynchites rutilus septentrionalis]